MAKGNYGTGKSEYADPKNYELGTNPNLDHVFAVDRPKLLLELAMLGGPEPKQTKAMKDFQERATPHFQRIFIGISENPQNLGPYQKLFDELSKTRFTDGYALKLSQRYGITPEEAREIIGVVEMQNEEIRKECKATGQKYPSNFEIASTIAMNLALV